MFVPGRFEDKISLEACSESPLACKSFLILSMPLDLVSVVLPVDGIVLMDFLGGLSFLVEEEVAGKTFGEAEDTKSVPAKLVQLK